MVETFVVARLIGLPLLTLEARLVLSDRRDRPPRGSTADVRAVPAQGRVAATTPLADVRDHNGALRQAVRLLEQGSTTLAEAREIC